jgi:hypothetical protein
MVIVRKKYEYNGIFNRNCKSLFWKTYSTYIAFDNICPVVSTQWQMTLLYMFLKYLFYNFYKPPSSTGTCINPAIMYGYAISEQGLSESLHSFHILVFL